MDRRTGFRRHRSNFRRADAYRLRVEPLEARCLLALVTPTDDFFAVHQNSQPDALDVLANDRFDEEYTGERRITSVSYGSQGGSISIGPDGQSVLYAPPADFEGEESFIYVIDGQFAASVKIDVGSPLEPDEYTIPPDGLQRTLDVLANDPFWAGYAGPREITSVSVGSEGGTVAIAEDGKSVLYTPPDEAFGSETFVYVIDGLYPTRVTIYAADPLEDDEFRAIQQVPRELDVLANDPFWPNYSGERRITHVLDDNLPGTLEIAEDGRTLLYTPPDDFAGSAYFRYVVDGTYEEWVRVSVKRPVGDDHYELDHNSTEQLLRVTENDRFVLDYWQRVDRVTAVTEPESGGTAVISEDGQSIIYTPPQGFSGTDTFTYTADGLHEAQVTVKVTRPVRDDAFREVVYQDIPNARLDVLANDFFGNGYTGSRRITAVSETENGGQVSITADGRFLTYTPAPGHAGEDRFTYTVDGELEAEVWLYVEPLAQHDHDILCADAALVPYSIDVLANDHFDRGYAGPGEITAVSDPVNGGSVSVADGRILFTPAPTVIDEFTYTVDGQYEGSVVLEMRWQIAGDWFVIDQNRSSGPLDVLANDFQPDRYNTHRKCWNHNYRGPRLITDVGETEQGGTVTIAEDGRSVHYEPPADFIGTDRFTYTVDGIMRSTVGVNVIRHVRDDEFRVDAADGGQDLPVLVNDLFSADYRGAQQITHVTETAAGGTVAVSEDGRSIHYTPPEGFVGTDTFTYTVDGALKAEVRVVVDESATERFPTFGTLEAYQQFLIDDALERYDHLFGKPARSWWGCVVCDVPVLGAGPEATLDRSHSETNVQVAGIDEADLMEFDSDYVYVLTGQDLVIADAWPAEEIAIASRVDIEGRSIGQYLKGDRLTVISQVGGGYTPRYFLGDFDAGPGGISSFPLGRRLPFSTIVTIIDVGDRTAPEIVQTTSMEGRYVQSRGIGDYVYVLVQSDNAIAPPPLVIKPDDDCSADDPIVVPFSGGTYETREEYLARVTANLGDFVDAALPNYSSYGPDGELVRTGLVTEPEEILRPLLPDVTNLINVVSFHVPGDEPGLAHTSSVYTSGAGTVYASLDNFYVFDRDRSSEDGLITRIMKFDWEPETGGVEFAATGTVAGRMLNQFSADEHDGHLRIATTINNSGSGNYSRRAENTLFVLEEDDGVLENVGGITNLALDETIRSVRFMGERAFIVTFRNIDPLFALDLSDPADPRAVGHLALPGFSSYMQMIDDTHLLTVGKNTPNGWSGPTQVALFDVSDLSRPRRVDEYTFARFSTSEAELDHHAFGYYAEHGLLAVPTRRGYYERVDENGDGYREGREWVEEHGLAVLAIDAAHEDAIQWRAEIPHETLVRRSGYIGDRLYSIAEGSIKAVDVADPETVIGELAIEDWYEELPPTPVDVTSLVAGFSSRTFTAANVPRFPALQPASPLSSAVERAKSSLADRLGTEAGASLVVVAERSGSATREAFNVVLQVGQRHYWYRVAGDSVRLVDSEFAFAESGDEADIWREIRPRFATQPTAATAAAVSGLSTLTR